MNMNNSVAIIIPQIGGGTQRHAMEMAMEWSAESAVVTLIQPYGKFVKIGIIIDSKVKKEYEFPVSAIKNLVSICQLTRVSCVHFHHFYKMDRSLLKLPQLIGASYCVTLHDYYLLCPYFTFTTEDDVYCEEFGDEQCNCCLKKRILDTPFWGDIKNIQEWRHKSEMFLKKASMIIVPNITVKKRFNRYFPTLNIDVNENPELLINNNDSSKGKKIKKDELVVGIIGLIDKKKGRDIILQCAQRIQNTRRKVRFEVFGDFDEYPFCYVSLKNITIHGAYQDISIYDELKSADVDFFWFPMMCPDTYNYTLTIPLALKKPVLSTNLGATGNRVIANCGGKTYPWNYSIDAIVDEILSFSINKYTSKALDIKNIKFPIISQYYYRIEYNPEINVDLLDFEISNSILDEIISKDMNISIETLRGKEFILALKYCSNIIKKIVLVFYIDKEWLLKYIVKAFRHAIVNMVLRVNGIK